VKAELDKDFISTQTDSLIAESGSQLPGAPSSVLSINLDKSWEISGDMDLTVGLNGYYQGDSENFIRSGHYLSEKFSSFALLGATATLTADNWSAMLYARNLTDEAGASGSFPCTYFCSDNGFFENWYGNGNRQFIVQPRTFGVKFSYNF
jgi:hypothetical protein